MKHSVNMLFLTLALMTWEITAQEIMQAEKKRVVIVPSDYMLTVTASQPDCPLEFTKATLVLTLSGDLGRIRQVRNRGSKPIRAYTVAELNTAGTGDVVERRSRVTDELLMPGQTSPRSKEGEEVEIINLSDKLRDSLKLHGSMQMVAVFMIVRVEFADGTTYNDEPTYKALEAYFEDLAEKVELSK